MSYADFKERRSIGDKMLVGESYTLKGVSFTPTKYGDVAVFETDGGKRYSGATAIVEDARFMVPDDFPMTVKVVEVESANGRKYQCFAQP